MSNRRDFLKGMLGVSLTTGTTAFLEACAGGLAYYKAKTENGNIRIPKSDAAALDVINGIMIVRSAGQNSSIILRNMGGQIVALSATCTHRGCEVRPSLIPCNAPVMAPSTMSLARLSKVRRANLSKDSRSQKKMGTSSSNWCKQEIK